MSRILVFEQTGNSLGEIHGVCNRGWTINGGGTTTINLANAEALKPWLQLGCILYVEHPDLPAWAGVLDTPWKAISPVQLTVYDISYLLHLRSPEAPMTIRGNTAGVAAKIIEYANQLGDIRVRAGRIDASDNERDEKFEIKPYWDMLLDLVKRYGYEMVTRVERGADNRLTIYIDIAKVLSYSDPIALSDGQGGNMQITDAQVDGEIWNRVIGTSDESTYTSRKKTAPREDGISIGKHGLRNTVKLFSGITNQTALENVTSAHISDVGNPNLLLTVNILNRLHIFRGLRVGNRANLRATKLTLPGGRQGWNGVGRILSMFYDETKKMVSSSFEGEL